MVKVIASIKLHGGDAKMVSVVGGSIFMCFGFVKLL